MAEKVLAIDNYFTEHHKKLDYSINAHLKFKALQRPSVSLFMS